MNFLRNKGSLMKAGMLTPGVALYLVFMILPIFLSTYYSFTNWNGFNPSWDIVGFRNYLKSFSDSKFLYSLRFTFGYTVVITIVSNVMGVTFAVLLNSSGKITNFYRSVFFLPLLISPIAAGFVWKVLFNYTGIINSQLEALFGIQPILFLGDAIWTIPILGFFQLWQSTGFCMIIYLAGLQSISHDLYDSADIDGAGSWKKFIYVTFPSLAPATTSCVTFMFTAGMRAYPRILVLTAGGPAGATETIAYRVVDLGFGQNKLGLASSQAVIALVLTATVSIILSRVLRKREEYLH